MAPTQAPPKIFIFGAGNVGLGLALACHARGLQVRGLWNRGAERARRAQPQEGGAPFVVSHGAWPKTLGDADTVLIAVNDAAIAAVSAQLTTLGLLVPGMLVAHTSGCLPACVLDTPHGVHQGSLHPLLACPTPEVASGELPKAFYAIEGAPEATSRLTTLVAALGGRSQVLPTSAKAAYHAAAVLASNAMVALLKVAADEARAAGLDNLDAPLARMALGALEKALQLGIVPSLTGPALRGDTQTLKKHWACLSPQGRSVYGPLTQVALGMAHSRGLSDHAVRQAMDVVGAR